MKQSFSKSLNLYKQLMFEKQTNIFTVLYFWLWRPKCRHIELFCFMIKRRDEIATPGLYVHVLKFYKI
jgi:hypothetical protein